MYLFTSRTGHVNVSLLVPLGAPSLQPVSLQVHDLAIKLSKVGRVAFSSCLLPRFCVLFHILASNMKLFIPLFALAIGSAFSQMVNRTGTNGWGSTPAQRHYISAAQALVAINAAQNYSNSIGSVQSLVLR